MNEWKVKDVDTGDVWHKDSRNEAQEAVEEFGHVRDLEIEAPDGQEKAQVTDDGAVVQQGGKTDGGTEVVDEPENPVEKPTPPEPEPSIDAQTNESSGLQLNIGSDPLDTLPGWMITEVSYSDRGDTTTTVNKRGCQVIASYLGLEYETEAVTRASESEWEYAEFKCTVTKPNGRSYTGHGTARADGNDQGDGDGWKLDMQAETRSFKRAVKGATGGGIEAFAKEQQE